MSGTIGRYPVGGHSWAQMQWLAGFLQMGHEVTYLEECGDSGWVYIWQEDRVVDDLRYPTAYLRSCLDPLGVPWIYRAGHRSVGIDLPEFLDRCRDADLLLVRANSLVLWRDEYALPRVRAYLDVDPGFTQVQLVTGHDEGLTETVDRCERLFTIAQRIGREDCAIPDTGREWIRTLQPVALPHWPQATGIEATHFTTVMHWRGHVELEHEGIRYGRKDLEFPRFFELPGRTDQPFRIALTGTDPGRLERHGWEVVPGWIISRTPESYRRFIQDSRAEFGVAKQGYVASHSGWFSDRSVCYLASGRPVLVEDTGLGDWLPIGKGVLTFTDVDSALAGIEQINGDYPSHARAARQVAEDVFAVDRVIPPLLQAVS